jgi:hypothetical protein
MTNVCQRISLVALALAFTLMGSRSANAADQTFLPADACNLRGASTGDFVIYMGAGTGEAWNIDIASNNPGAIDCALGQDHAADTNDDLIIYYDDRNGGASDPYAWLYCTVYEVNFDFSSIVNVGTKHACATAGGCATSPTAFASSGYLSFADVAHGGNGFATVECRIPGPPRGQGCMAGSRIKTLYLDEQ